MKKLLLALPLCFFVLNIYSQVANPPTPMELCDDNNSGDESEAFDLTTKDSEILGSQNPTDFVVAYYETQVDADNNTNAIISPYNNISNPQVLYVRVEDLVTGNYDTTTLTLRVNPLPSPTPSDQIPTLEVCDDDNDGFSLFDLTAFDSLILNGEVDVILSYYETVSDATNNVNAILNPLSYSNIVSTQQTIYARVENSLTGCFVVVNFDLVVNPLAIFNIDDYSICEGDTVIADTAIDPIIHSFQWSYNGSILPNEVSSSLTITQAGNYEVTAFNVDNGCLFTDTFSVSFDGSIPFNEPSPMYNCSSNNNGFAEFDLTQATPEILGGQTDLVVRYFATAAEAEEGITWIVDSFPYINFEAYYQILYFRVEDVVNGCYSIGTLELLVSEASAIPEITDLVICEANSDGFADFDLTVKDQEILESQSAIDLTVSYHLSESDALSLTNALVSPFTNTTNPQTIYVAVTGSLNCNIEIQSFNLIIDSNCVEDGVVVINHDSYAESFMSLEELIENVIAPQDAAVDNFVSQVNGNPTDNETKSYGYFTRGSAQNFPFEEGIVLSSGRAFEGGNTINNNLVSYDNGQQGDIDLESALNITNTNDAVFIKFDFVPIGDEISFRYIMASEEYDGNTECNFADSFAFLLREAGTTDYINLAVLPDGTPVNVTNINNSGVCTANPEFFEGYNIGETNYGGRTAVLTASASVVPLTTYEIKLVIADQGDSIWDTSIFLEAFNLGNADEGFISVEAFNDFNDNGIKDNDETRFTNGSFTYEKNNDGVINIVNSSTGSFTIFSDNESDTYDISFTINDEFVNCFTQNITSFDDVSVLFGEVVDVDFPVIDDQDCEDLAVYLINDWAPPRPGFTHNNYLYIENLGFSTITSGTLEFVIDPQLVYNSTFDVNPAYTITNTATGFTVDFVNLPPGEVESIGISITCPVTVPLDEIVTNMATYLTDNNDLVAINNTSTLSEVVVGSWDPNDKMEAHGPEIVYDDFITSDEWLYYTIRFQNLGTAEAIFVRIEDELDAQLDETTFQMIRSSHDYVVTRTGNSLEWYFEDINLPAEQDDAEGSNGFVYFRVKPVADYALGDVIPNNAAIYFDFNVPVITNTFTTTFVEPLSLNEFNSTNFSIYPNPAKDKVTISMNGKSLVNLDVKLIDVQGKAINVLQINYEGLLELDVSSLKSGLYFIELNDGSNTVVEKLIIK